MPRAGLSLLIVGLVAVAAAYALTLAGLSPSLAPWWLALGSTAVLAGLADLGAARRGRRTPLLTAAMRLAFVSVAAGFVVPLLMPPPAADAALLLGVPRPTAWLLLLAGLGPLLALPLAYAAAFDCEVLSEADLASLRSAAAPERDA